MRVDLKREKNETPRLVENIFFRSFTITDKSNMIVNAHYQKFTIS